MQLLPNRIRKQLPPLHATDGVDDPLVICCIRAGLSGPLEFYVMEFDGKDTIYALTATDKIRKGYHSLKQIKRCFKSTGVECDSDFTPRPLAQVLKETGYWMWLEGRS